MTVDRKNLAVGLIYLVIALAAGIAALGYRLGTLQRMGPGFFPAMVAVALGLVGIAIIVKAMIRAKYPTGSGWDLRPALAVCAATVAFGLTLKPGGLLVATAAVVAISALGNPNRNWRTVLISIAVLAPSCWLIFVEGLRLPLTLLPAGWGI